MERVRPRRRDLARKGSEAVQKHSKVDAELYSGPACMSGMVLQELVVGRALSLLSAGA